VADAQLKARWHK